MYSKDKIYNGALISELGAKRYVKAVKDLKTANIDAFLRGPVLVK